MDDKLGIYVYLCLPATGFAKKKKHASSCSFGLILNVPLGSILCMSYSKLYYIQLNTKIHPSCLLCCVIENITKCSYLCQKCNSFIIRIMFTQQLIHTSTDTFIFCVYCQKFCQCNTICYFFCCPWSTLKRRLLLLKRKLLLLKRKLLLYQAL